MGERLRGLAAALVLLAALAEAQGGAAPTVVELKDGTRVVGRIVEDDCSDEVLVIRQLRGDAKTSIPWSSVKDPQARQLRVELGFEVVEAAPGALTIQGHEIRNKAGSVFRGLWLNEKSAKTEGVYVLKTSEGERRIRSADIAKGPDPVELSQLDVYTPRELYERKLAEKEPATAEDHFLLAEFAVAIDALDEAKQHYEQALALGDPRYTREKLERRVAHVQRLLEQSEARAALKEIQRALFANRYDKAGALIQAFKEKYGSDDALSKAIADVEEKSQAERQRYYVSHVPSRVREAVRALLDRKVKEEKDLTLRGAQEYAGGEAMSDKSVSRHAIDLVAEEIGLPAEEILRFWTERERRTIYKAFYRDGTFAILENLEDALAKAPKPPKPGKGKEAPQLPKPSKPMTPEEWWGSKVEQRKYMDMRDWLFAWWAEKSGMCELIEPKDETCPTCIGKGYTQRMVITAQGSLPFYNRCQTCYMAKFFRVVRFK